LICFLAGLDRGFNYNKLSEALHHIQRGAVFIATNTDSTYPVEGN
jgi:4-nitrophenyl phosphatase